LTKKAELALRDRFVFNHLKNSAFPMAVTMAGGFAPEIQDIVDIHFQTIETALEFEDDTINRFCDHPADALHEKHG
jgi:hypothetical protein